MRWSKAFIPTLREEPAKTESVSHKLLLRAGMIRQTGSGIYSLLPLAIRVRNRIMGIIRDEMNKIGGQEFLLPALVPAEVWKTAGRWETMGEILFRFKDRRDAEIGLGTTHEEVFSTIAKQLTSYRQVPQIWYQIQTKFRDEPRPRSGLLRVREFTMKDAYSFDLDRAGLDQAFELHRNAYVNIFTRCGVKFVQADASSGIMGGAQSTEFLALTDAGEDHVVVCSSCDYTANLEKAVSATHKIDKTGEVEKDLQRFETPDIRTIEALVNFAGGAAADHQVKTLVYFAGERMYAILLRGDHDLNLTRLADHLRVPEVRPATPEEVFGVFGAHPGSLGAVGLRSSTCTSERATGPADGVRNSPGTVCAILADTALRGRFNMTTGANQDDFHLRGVSLGRDIIVDEWSDFRLVTEGDACIECGAQLHVKKGLEIGHIFKLGTRYSEAFEASVLAEDGSSIPLVMGSYGIGVERLMAAAIEMSHDDGGIIWPKSIAPFDVLLTPINSSDPQLSEVADRLYNELTEAGIACLLDDRNERAGVKFNDGDLIGIPLRITIGKKVQSGKVELFQRSTRQVEEVEIADVVATCLEEKRK